VGKAAGAWFVDADGDERGEEHLRDRPCESKCDGGADAISRVHGRKSQGFVACKEAAELDREPTDNGDAAARCRPPLPKAFSMTVPSLEVVVVGL
jgi:hypothetical protein